LSFKIHTESFFQEIFTLALGRQDRMDIHKAMVAMLFS
jgi:hypothetical protein